MKKVFANVLTLIVVLLFFSSCAATKDVPGLTGKITIHPSKITLAGKNDKTYYLFYDSEHKYLFITEEEDIYDKIIEWLPEEKIKGNCINITATSIPALAVFTSEQLQKESQRVGEDLKGFKVGRITNWEKDNDNQTNSKKQNSTNKLNQATDKRGAGEILKQ